ncbi:hypothetical protein IAR55_000875 [Kwoniella newhampshirensis]|uniref:Uncharacterized protein n=1 Tax=Kwoniella newhampshirensis TaxID=1651941 RepID=A0AAW0Z462_9TREE
MPSSQTYTHPSRNDQRGSGSRDDRRGSLDSYTSRLSGASAYSSNAPSSIPEHEVTGSRPPLQLSTNFPRPTGGAFSYRSPVQGTQPLSGVTLASGAYSNSSGQAYSTYSVSSVNEIIGNERRDSNASQYVPSATAAAATGAGNMWSPAVGRAGEDVDETLGTLGMWGQNSGNAAGQTYATQIRPYQVSSGGQSSAASATGTSHSNTAADRHRDGRRSSHQSGGSRR